MDAQTLILEGRKYVLLPWDQYERLSGGLADPPALPPLPEPDAEGNVPAIEYARVSLARKLILARHDAGLTQAELAKRAGVRPETVSRLEAGKHTPDAKTLSKLLRAAQPPKGQVRRKGDKLDYRGGAGHATSSARSRGKVGQGLTGRLSAPAGEQGIGIGKAVAGRATSRAIGPQSTTRRGKGRSTSERGGNRP